MTGSESTQQTITTGSGIWWQLFEHAYDPIWLVDGDGSILHANVATETSPMGFPRSELLGRPFLDLLASSARPAVDKAWKKVMAHGVPERAVVRFEGQVGTTPGVILSIAPLRERELSVVTLYDLRRHAPAFQLEQCIGRLSVLNSISEALDTTLDLDETLNLAVSKSVQAFGVAGGAILLIDDDTQDLVFRAQHGWRRHDCVQDQVRIKAGSGWCGKAVRTGQILLVDDVSNDSRVAISQLRDEGFEAMALAPVRSRGRVLGVLAVMSRDVHEFGKLDRELLPLIADRIALALDSARLYTRIQRSIQHQTALHEVALATQGVVSLQSVMEQGLRALLTLFELDAAAIHFVDRQNRLIPITVEGSAVEYWQKLRENPPQLEDTLAGRYALRSRSLMIQNLNTFEETVDPRIYASGMCTIADMPLLVSGRLIGILEVSARRAGALTLDDLPLLESLGTQLASAIEAARLQEQTEQRVQNLTTLTGLSASLNRTMDLDRILNIVLDEILVIVSPAFGLRKGAILLADPNRQRLRLAVIRGLPPDVSLRYVSLTFPSSGSGTPPVVLPDITFDEIIASSQIVELPATEKVFPETLFAGGPLIAIPLRVEERPVGVVLVVGQVAGSAVRRLLLALADLSAISIEKTRLHQETRRRLDEVSLLHDVGLAAARTLDFGIIVSHTVQAIQQTLGFECVGVLLLDASGEYLHLHPSHVGIELADPEVGFPVAEGTVGRVARTGKAIAVADLAAAENPVVMFPGARSELCVPLKVGEQVIGVIDAQSSRPEASGPDDERLIATIAGQLAVAIENSRLHQETQRRLREMTTLFQFAHHLSTHLHMETLLQTVVDSIREVLGCRGVSVALLDQETQMLEIRAAAGLGKVGLNARLRVGEGIMGRVAATGQSIYVPDAHKVEGFIFFDQTFHSLLTVPLVIKNRVIGTLSIDHQQPDAFDANDERLVTIAAAQAAVAIENARLFEALQERATSLAQAYEELKAIDRMKDELVQNVSHELRTPLTFVRGYVGLLLGGEMGPLNARQRQSLEIVSTKAATVGHLVSNIILLQQLQKSTLQLVITDLGAVAKEAVSRAQSAAREQGISLRLQVPSGLPPILGDPERVTLVFQHILDNAIKFSANGGVVQLQIEEQNDRVQVAISDQGIGIAQDQADRIFDRFYQIDSSATRRYEGTGLGLSIVKRIVEAHGGRVWLKSRLGKGSTFFFTFPKSRPTQTQENTGSDDGTPDRGWQPQPRI